MQQLQANLSPLCAGTGVCPCPPRSPHASPHRRPEQPGFTAGRSTVDAILTMRLLEELHLEFGQTLHVAYVELKSIFDSVDKQALWMALRGVGVPDTLLRLVQDLHSGTRARVRGRSCHV